MLRLLAFTIAVLDQGTSSERVLNIAPFLFEQTGYQFELGLVGEQAEPIQLRLRGQNLRMQAGVGQNGCVFGQAANGGGSKFIGLSHGTSRPIGLG